MNAETPQSLRILLVDDRRDAILPVQKMLQMLGHTVETAGDAPAAIAKATALPPQIVLCDVGLPPGKGGYDVARALRAKPETASAYLVALTGYGEDEDRAQAREAGFDFHVTKPVDRSQLERLISQRPTFAS